MSFDLTGYVLRAPRSAPSNAKTTGDASSGVLRDVRDLPASYDLPGEMVEPYADMYRAAVLNHPVKGTQEYLIWAANSSNLSLVEGVAWAVTFEGTASIPTGSLAVSDTSDLLNPTKNDGTARLVVTDTAGRSITDIRKIVIVRGDNPVPVEAGEDSSGVAFASQDADSGLVVLDTATLTSLSGGVSTKRGDRIFSVTYVLAGQTFWWTRNDQYTTRFGWRGKVQRWEPFKGSGPISVGTLLPDESYLLTPRPDRFTTGDTLPGVPASQDATAMVRVGTDAGATSLPVNVQVITDEEVEDSAYTFPVTDIPDAVMGLTSGIIRFHPDYVETHAGKTIWYVYEDFQEESTGGLGALKDAAAGLYLCPIPGPDDRPFISLGSRRYLIPYAVDQESDLPGSVNEGEVYWARSTGRIKLSQTDIDKADPDAAGFNKLYLGCQVIYDGVALSTQPVPLPNPCQLTESDGTTVAPLGIANKLFMPEAKPLPFPGTSGALRVYDGSGVEPDTTTDWRVRPGGTGLIRSLEAPGDKVFFTPKGAWHTTNIVDFEKGLGHADSLPNFKFFIRKGRIWVALQSEREPADLPRVAIGTGDRIRHKNETVYFRHAMVTPAIYTSEARIYSRVQEPFTLDGTEVLAFRIDTTDVQWAATTLVTTLGTAQEFTAVEVAAHLQTAITAAGGHASAAYAANGKVVLRAEVVATGVVEIGFGSISDGSFAARDLTGCAALGFLPGWRLDPFNDMTWLPDSGMSFGVDRSPLNRDRSKDKPDFVGRSRFSYEVLSKSVGASPYFFVDYPPLLDVPGFDDGVFFLLQDGLNFKYLNHMGELLYDFSNNRFGWVDTDEAKAQIEYPTRHLAFGNQLIIGDSLHPNVISGGGLYLAETGGALTLITQGEDYLLPDNGDPGIAHLIEVIGEKTASGSNGSISLPGTFDDANVSDWTNEDVSAGYWLKVTGGDNLGVFIISSVSAGSLTLETDVPFLTAATQVTWSIHKGYSRNTYDPGVVADVVYTEFNHLLTEPFKIRLLHTVGNVPADASAQTASRSVAVMSDALGAGRIISIRFGQLTTDDTATLTGLLATKLGALANDALVVPSLTSPHFTNAAFSIQVGSTKYLIGDPTYTLNGVSSLTADLAGDVVEYDTATGVLNFGTTVLTNQAESTVFYVEEFSAPSDLAVGVAEYDPATGALNFSATDLSNHAGTAAYFVEQLITEKQLDARISPMAGAVHVSRALRNMQIVEVDYFQADRSGNKKLDDDGNTIQTTEKLPLYVRQETATRVSEKVYSFNPELRTVAEHISLQVWVGVNLQNYGSVDTVEVNFDTNELHFSEEVDSSEVVTLNYAVYEAFGGEKTYTVSKRPVYRPPFFLEKNTSTFTLETDRTVEMEAGKLFRVGPVVLYIKSSAYDSLSDETTVTVFPTMEEEVGSRAPGHDAEAILSSEAVATTVNGTSTAAKAGFLLEVTSDYEPVDRGMMEMVFLGDVRQYAQAGHVLELGGEPHMVSGSELSDDGRHTKVSVSSPFLDGYTFGSDTVKLSARPVYPPGARQFNGIFPLLSFEDYELVLFGEVDDSGAPLPGRTLTETTEYSLDPDSGAIELLQPRQEALKPSQRLVLRYTKLRELGPFVQNSMVLSPRFKAVYAYITFPTKTNGYLAAVLAARYSFRNPDSFYCRAVPISTYMGEVAQLAATSASSGPHSGPLVTSGASTDNWSYGNLSILSERRELLDRDRAGRMFISFYNSVIVAFEQIREAINGEIVGDWDGKFRFEVGRGKAYAPPGYEDQITGYMNPRLVWADVFEAATESYGVTTSDPIVEPSTSTREAGTLEVDGDPMDGFLVKFYQKYQKDYVHNDIDDVVFIRPKWPRLSLSGGSLKFWVPGEFGRMGDPHALSRLFPESAQAFTTLFPGMQTRLSPAEGVYAFARMTSPPAIFKGEPAVIGSTFRTTVGVIANPAWGEFKFITDCEPRERYARARIWRYSSTGFPEMDALLPSGSTFADNPRPAIIATVLPFKDFPIDPDTGFPDTTQLTGGGGDLMDLSTGDMTLSTPAFKVTSMDDREFHQVAFGRPDGSLFEVGTGKIIKSIPTPFGDFDFAPRYKGVFLNEVLLGCIVTFSDSKDPITDPSDLFMTGLEELSTSELTLSQGDTIYAVPPGGLDTEDLEMDEPPTTKQINDLIENTFTYNRFQLGQKRKQGLYVDNTLPSILDPNPLMLKELLNQKVPKPLTTIEADVEFSNGVKKPFAFPALKGEPTNDNGDYGIPYKATSNTELDRLGPAADSIRGLMGPDASSADRAVYPDEIVGADGALVAAATSIPPATLTTAKDLTPAHVANDGKGPVDEFDLLLVQTGQTGVDAGMTGILQLGSVASGELGVARFVSPSKLTSPIKYVLDNAVGYLAPTHGDAGAELINAGADLRINISLGGLYLNDGNASSGAVGGWNTLIATTGNVVTLKLLNAAGNLGETITITSTTVTGDLASPTLTSVPEFHEDYILLPGGSGATSHVGAGTYTDFTLSVDTTGGGSTTGYVKTDRRTFFEVIDLSRSLERGTATVNSYPVDLKLSVTEVNGLTVNDPSTVNGGDPFTFLPRTTGAAISTDWSVATASGDGSEGSSTTTMAFEGINNTPLTAASNIIFSAIPSSGENESGVICAGVGTVGSPQNTITGLTATEAAMLPNVVAGDLCRITGDASGDAAETVGTYAVRGVIKDSNPTTPTGYAEVSAKAVAPSTTGSWLEIEFPKIVSFDSTAKTVTVDALQTVTNSPTGTAWATSGTLFVLVKVSDYSTSVAIPYTGLSTLTFTVDDSTVTDILLFDGTIATSTDQFWDALVVGQRVSGMVYLPVGDRIGALPKANAVGYNSGGGTSADTASGLHKLTIRGAISGGADETYSYTGTAGQLDGSLASIGVVSRTASDPAVYSSTAATYFDDVPDYIDISTMDANEWVAIRGATTAFELFAGVVVGDQFVLNSLANMTGTAGFRAASGIYLEPSFPTPVSNLADGFAKVVDASNSGTGISVGMRTAVESVSFEIRRIRRWHSVTLDIGANLQPLRYAYEIRRGTTWSYTASSLLFDASGGTQLGDFENADVNIHVGDQVRYTDNAGDVHTAEIAVVKSGTQLKLRAPGFGVDDITGTAFEVYLRQAPVPHEQSNEQLMALITDTVVYSQTGVPATPVGGKVLTVNELKDGDAYLDFQVVGAQVGDILVVDPAGAVEGLTGSANPVEEGARPFGDKGCPLRTDGAYEAKAVSDLDDNRGHYWITAVTADTITVSPAHTFAGEDDDVTFGSDDTTKSYVVLPTVTASTAPWATGARENQNDLRPTAASDVNDSYATDNYSIQSFSYKIIRPSSLFSTETVDLVLFMRERMLSWIEEMNVPMQGDSGGTYSDFQDDDHITDLGPYPNGIGVPFNDLLEDLEGQVLVSPFANAQDCLSILDRRFWCLDLRLDSLTPPSYSTFTDPYTEFQIEGGERPVLTDLIDSALDRTDRFRNLRYTWINYRTNRQSGTLAAVDRFDEQLEERLEEMEDMLRIQESMEGTE